MRSGTHRLPQDSVHWHWVQHRADGNFDWRRTDELVMETAKRDIDLMLTIYGTPDWLTGDMA